VNIDSSFPAADAIDWSKGLIPAVVQDVDTGLVLMLGYMNAEALVASRERGQVTFFSRSKQRLWTKGESSGHVLELVSIAVDCDGDTLLVLARPRGPTCHQGTTTCFGDFPGPDCAFLGELARVIEQRHAQRPAGSYTTKLFDAGTRRIAQKVGEEGVETALAAVVQDDEALLGESADLLFHLLVLLRDRGLGLGDLARTLRARHR
jgi:phosphoribosyl-AMP cyclohydrolase / phosphoribosyl-ATP pyrophosphohydrolase